MTTATLPANGNGVSTPATNQPPTFRTILDRMKGEIARALPKQFTVDRFLRVALTAYNTQPALLQCDQTSIIACIVRSAQLGLELDGIHAYLVPYKGKATLIPSYRGLIELARRSGQIGPFNAFAVYEGDEFDVSYGLEPSVKHKPDFSRERDPKAITYVYAVAKIKGWDTPQIAVMSRAEVEAVRSRSMAKNSGPWVTDYEAMALKTVAKRLCKWLPLSIETREALAENDDPLDVPMDVPSEPAPTAPPPESKLFGGSAPEPEADKPAGEHPRVVWLSGQFPGRTIEEVRATVDLYTDKETDTFDAESACDAMKAAAQ